MRYTLIMIAALAVGASACRTTAAAKADLWPQVNVLPDKPPADLERGAPATVLRQGSDGFTYIVGGLPNNVATGSAFLGRYSGEWPMQDLARPPLVSGRVLKRFGRDVALVSLSYQLPDSEIDGLEVTWEDGESEELGKGLAVVLGGAEEESSDLQLSVGSDLGVQPGDVYGLFEPVRVIDDAHSLQMARRLLGICLVDDAEDEVATCRRWRGSTMVPGKRPPKAGDVAIFLEHTYGRAPRRSTIQVARVQGATSAAEQTLLRDAVELYVQSLPHANVEVQLLDAEFDATDVEFDRVSDAVGFLGHAQIVVGATLVERDGARHLVVNHTGVGSAVGPGMVAAPPQGGVDLGPVDDLTPTALRGFASTLWSAVLVYRGQTSEALMHLHLALNDRVTSGPVRWHARDQYAMRWAALGQVDQALWLVLEDEQVAAARNDQRAYLNALGTRVRLYDMLDLPSRALDTSASYLDGAAAATSTPQLDAIGMHAEMLLNAGDIAGATAAVEQLHAACPDGCAGRLALALVGVYVAVPHDESELRQQLLDDIVAHAENGPRSQMALARLFQGLDALGEDRLEDALIAFLEAERLFMEGNDLTNTARTKYFMSLTQMSRKEPQKAFELALESIERDRELGDFASAARTYELLSNLYTNFDTQGRPGPWLGAARDVLATAVHAQLARGNFSKTSDALLGLGMFLTRVGELSDAQATLQRGVLFAVRSTRFDVAAMCHLWLGIIAREKNDHETFVDEIFRARLMATISADEGVIEVLERVLNPPDEGPDTPTQVL